MRFVSEDEIKQLDRDARVVDDIQGREVVSALLKDRLVFLIFVEVLVA
jgi:hypothetical protein